jgi:tRNA-modifying protein YgfZ
MESAYAAARRDAIVVARTDRVLLRMHGRDPLRMIQGLVTNDVAGAPADAAVPAAMLTPKGRMLAELRVLRREDDILLETDAAAAESLTAALKRSVPPLFARFEALPDMACLGVYGPAAAARIEAVLGPGALPMRPEEDARADVPLPEGAGGVVHAVRSGWTGGAGFDLLGPAAAVRELGGRLLSRGAVEAGPDTLEVLRIEAGRPRWGAELDEGVIPLEAGLLPRYISTGKGCYTGQEVIIRILHRGHVNRHLRGVLLGTAEAPPGTELHHPESGKVMGRLTSVCASPAHGQFIALGYVRREIVPPAPVHLGAGDGPAVTVVELPFPQ